MTIKAVAAAVAVVRSAHAVVVALAEHGRELGTVAVTIGRPELVDMSTCTLTDGLTPRV